MDTKMTSLIIFSIILMCCGAVLIYEMISQYQTNKKNYFDKFNITTGTVSNISDNKYNCFAKTNCQMCSNGYNFPSCDLLINSERTGICHYYKTDNCCQKQCYKTICDNYHNCHQVMCNYYDFCVDCYCIQYNPYPTCQVIRGDCYNPLITIKYNVNNTTYIYYMDKSCSMNNIKCLTKFLNGWFKGKKINVKYHRNNPTKIVIGDNNPKFKYSRGQVTGIVFGIIMCLIGIVIFPIGVIECYRSVIYDSYTYF